MKNSKSIFLASMMLVSTLGFAQLPKSMLKTSAITDATAMANNAVITDSTGIMLDKAVSANASGDKAATVLALKASTASMEKTATASKSNFKDKLMAQVRVLHT